MINESSCGEFLESGDELGLRLAVERYSSFSPEKLASMGNKGRAWVLKNRLYSTLSAHYLSIISEHESATVCS